MSYYSSIAPEVFGVKPLMLTYPIITVAKIINLYVCAITVRFVYNKPEGSSNSKNSLIACDQVVTFDAGLALSAMTARDVL